MSSATRVGLGVTGYTLISEGKVFDPIRGGQYVRVYETDTVGLANVEALLSWWERYEVDASDAPKIRVSIFSPTEDEQAVFELLATFKEKDILEHPSAKLVSESDIKTIINFLKKPIADSDPAVTGGGTGGVDAAMALYRLMLGGTKKYATEDYVLRYTVTVTNAVTLSMAYANTGKLFTPTQIANPSISLITLPSGIASAMSNIPAQGPLDGHLWSWLKRAPTARQTQIGKVVITQEWWLQLWSTFVYAPVS